MIPARTLAARFMEGDREFRPRHLTKLWVVRLVKNDPVRAVQVHHELMTRGGTSHAALEFMLLLEQMQEKGEFFLWWHMVLQKREWAPLPA